MSSPRRGVRGVGRPLGRSPRIGIALGGGLALAAVAVAGINAYIVLAARGEATDDVSEVPPAEAAIVLGALVEPDGRMSAMLADRVRRAIELWRADKVDRLLVTGDHREWEYDEAGTMRKALLRAGVPARAIFTDRAGFDTWASMVRAREVFEVDSAVIVTQGFHMARALYLADEAGLDATGLTADLRGYGGQGSRSELREVLSRVKAVGDSTLNRAVLLGPARPISGDGRSSWGPSSSPDTPAAGAP